jgi:pimeloyl-ACP methyl ester carboxylesterase
MEPLAELMFAATRRLVNGPVIWGGHSWGGKLAAMIAALHPESADGLLLLDPTPASCVPIPAEMFVDMTFGAELGPWTSLEEAEKSVRNLPQYTNWNEDLRRAFERGVICGADGKPRARISRETLIAICAAAGKDYSDIIRAVSCPTFFAVSNESLDWQKQVNFALLPNAAWAVIKSNHWLMTGNPIELNRAVQSWLAAGEESIRLAR